MLTIPSFTSRPNAPAFPTTDPPTMPGTPAPNSRPVRPALAVSAASFGKADSPKGALITDLDGNQRLYAGNTVTELNWHVYAGITKKAVYQPARAALNDHLTSGLIIVIGVGLVALAGIFTVARR